MLQTDAESVILEDAVEDYIGLWEIDLILNTLSPDASARSKREAGERALRTLLANGLVQVLRGVTPLGDQVVVANDDLEAALAPPEWRPSKAAEVHSRVAATDAGRAAYYNRPRQEG